MYAHTQLLNAPGRHQDSDAGNTTARCCTVQGLGTDGDAYSFRGGGGRSLQGRGSENYHHQSSLWHRTHGQGDLGQLVPFLIRNCISNPRLGLGGLSSPNNLFLPQNRVCVCVCVCVCVLAHQCAMMLAVSRSDLSHLGYFIQVRHCSKPNLLRALSE